MRARRQRRLSCPVIESLRGVDLDGVGGTNFGASRSGLAAPGGLATVESRGGKQRTVGELWDATWSELERVRAEKRVQEDGAARSARPFLPFNLASFQVAQLCLALALKLRKLLILDLLVNLRSATWLVAVLSPNHQPSSPSSALSTHRLRNLRRPKPLVVLLVLGFLLRRLCCQLSTNEVSFPTPGERTTTDLVGDGALVL